MSEMKCRFRGAGGLGGGAQRPPSSTPDPKVSSSCLLACFLVWLLLCKPNKWKRQKQKEKGEQLPKQKSNKSKKAAEAEKQQKQKSNKSKNNAEAEKQQKQNTAKSEATKIQKKSRKKRTSINMVDGSFVYCCLILFFMFLVVLPLLRCFFLPSSVRASLPPGCLASILPAFLTSYLDPFFPSFPSLRPGDQGPRGPGHQGDQGTKGTRSKHTRDGKGPIVIF